MHEIRSNRIVIFSVFAVCLSISICSHGFTYSKTNDPTLIVSNIYSGKTVFKRKCSVSSVALSSNGHILAAVVLSENPYRQSIKVWELPSGRVITKLAGTNKMYYSQVTFSPDGKSLAYATSENLRIVGIVSLKSNTQYKIYRKSYYHAGCLIFSPNSRYLAFRDDKTTVYDILKRKICWEEFSEECPVMFTRNSRSVLCAYYGTTAAIVSARVLDTRTGKDRVNFRPNGECGAIGVCDNDKICAFTCKDKKKWYIEYLSQTGKMQNSFAVNSRYETGSSRFSHNCALLYTTIYDRKKSLVSVYNARNGKLLRQFSGRWPIDVSWNNKHLAYCKGTLKYEKGS